MLGDLLHPTWPHSNCCQLESCSCFPTVQIVVNYVAKTPNGKVFDNSLAKGAPYYVRVGSGAVIPVRQDS